MTANVKLTKRGDRAFATYTMNVRFAWAAFLVTMSFLIFGLSTSNDWFQLSCILMVLGFSGLTVRYTARAGAYLAVSAMMDAFGPQDDDDA